MPSSAQLSWRKLLLCAAGALLLIAGCGTSGPEANTKFKPVDEEPEKPVRSSGNATGPDKVPGEDANVEERPAKPSTTNKGGNAKPAAKGSDSKDPALAGPTGDKVKLVRSLLRTIARQDATGKGC
jgi:hypothetical protein